MSGMVMGSLAGIGFLLYVQAEAVGEAFARSRRDGIARVAQMVGSVVIVVVVAYLGFHLGKATR